jgi:SAM-dependent methyltransferase
METMDNHQYAWLSEVLPPGPRRVLDAGCGRGELAAELMRRGHDVTAVDVSAEAVEAARAAGVPALQADITHYPDYDDGSFFDAVVMSLSLHHMHPLDAALDRISALLRMGGIVVMDEFAWDWADSAAATWFYDAGSLLAAAGMADLPRGVRDPVERWRETHADHTPAADMLAALGERFEITSLRREPYLSRYIGGKVTNGDKEIHNELWRIERDRIAAGTLPPTGFRLTARKM